MSHGTVFLIGDALRRSLARPTALVLWTLSVAAVLVSGTALFLIPTTQGTPGATAETYLVVQLAADPSEAAIARLASEIWIWPGVDGVAFRFPGETEPVPITQRALIVRLLSPDVRSAVESRLRALREVAGIQYHQRPSARTRVPPASRIGALVALVGTLALALWLGHRAVRGAAISWGRELALLRSCGTSPAMRQTPLFALGGMIGLVGGGLYVGVCWALWEWGRAVPYLQDVVPSFPHVWGPLVASGLTIGVGIGLVGSLVATLAPTAHS